jgi:hypothetical protein
VALSVYLGSYLVDATGDLRDVPAGGLYDRFLGWT